MAGTGAAEGPGGDEFVWARPDARLRPLVDLYSGYRMAATAPGTHQGVPGAHLTFLFCLEGTVDLLEMPDRTRSPGSFTAMVSGLHDGPAVIAQGRRRRGWSCG